MWERLSPHGMKEPIVSQNAKPHSPVEPNELFMWAKYDVWMYNYWIYCTQ